MILDLLKELFTPSNKTGPADKAYRRSSEGVYHVVLGAALMSLGSLLGLYLNWGLVALLYTPKELLDLSKGGDPWDSVEDILCVAFGAFVFTYPDLWPILTIALGAGLMIFEHARQRNE